MRSTLSAGAPATRASSRCRTSTASSHAAADEEVIPLCRELEIGFVPYFPLASGLLTGKYRRGEPAPSGSRLEGRPERLTDERFDRVTDLEHFATERGRTILELAVGALVSTPGVASVIAGATTPEQVCANAAAGSWKLSEEELRALADSPSRV